jgi:hypothetical protein
MRADLDLWESLILGDYLAGDLSAVDHALFPAIALSYRTATHVPEIATGSLTGPKLTAWYARMLALPIIGQTWPPHWGKPGQLSTRSPRQTRPRHDPASPGPPSPPARPASAPSRR